MEIDLRGLDLMLGISSPPVTLSPNSPNTTSSTWTTSITSASTVPSNDNSVTLILLVAGSVIGGIALLLLILALLYIRNRREKAKIMDTSSTCHRDSIHMRTDYSTRNRKNRAGMKIQNVRDPSPLVVHRNMEDLNLSKEEAVVTPYYTATFEQPPVNSPTHPKPIEFPRMSSNPALPGRISSTVVDESTSASPHAYPPASSSAFIPILSPRVPRSNNPPTRRRSLKKSRPGPNPGFEMITSPIDSFILTPTVSMPSTSQALQPEEITMHTPSTPNAMTIPILAPYHFPHQFARSRSSTTPHEGSGNRSRQDGERTRSATNHSSREQARQRGRSKRGGNATAGVNGLPSHVENSSRPTLSDD